MIPSPAPTSEGAFPHPTRPYRTVPYRTVRARERRGPTGEVVRWVRTDVLFVCTPPRPPPARLQLPPQKQSVRWKHIVSGGSVWGDARWVLCSLPPAARTRQSTERVFLSANQRGYSAAQHGSREHARRNLLATAARRICTQRSAGSAMRPSGLSIRPSVRPSRRPPPLSSIHPSIHPSICNISPQRAGALVGGQHVLWPLRTYTAPACRTRRCGCRSTCTGCLSLSPPKSIARAARERGPIAVLRHGMRSDSRLASIR